MLLRRKSMCFFLDFFILSWRPYPEVDKKLRPRLIWRWFTTVKAARKCVNLVRHYSNDKCSSPQFLSSGIPSMTSSYHLRLTSSSAIERNWRPSLNLSCEFNWIRCTSHIKVPVTLIFLYFWRKVKSSMDTNAKKTFELFTSFHGFWSQKDKNLSFDRADRGLVLMT